jgi:predicted alpha/beta hydrolase family esterase
MRTILFAHSGGSQAGPGEGSYDFIEALRRELGEGWEIRFPRIADPEAPDYAMWESLFKKEFARCPEGVVLLGHSLGGSMLLKYLSEHPVAPKIAALVSVSAPWWGPEGWAVEEFALDPNFAARLPAIPEIHFYHAQRDPVVPFTHLAEYKKALPGIQAHPLRREDHAFIRGLPELTTWLRSLP